MFVYQTYHDDNRRILNSEQYNQQRMRNAHRNDTGDGEALSRSQGHAASRCEDRNYDLFGRPCERDTRLAAAPVRKALVLPYQQIGTDFLAKRKRAYLADDMGLGKTFQAIRACDTVGADTVLVVCPATLKNNWKNEFEAWQVFPRSVTVIDAKQQRLHFADVTIVNYETLLNDSKFNQIMARKFDVVIFDEAHRLKNHKAARTMRSLGPKWDGENGIAGRAPRCWWLSGTPAPNNASELFTAARFIGGEYRSPWTFMQRYCIVVQTGFGQKIVGQRNVPELRDAMKLYVLRRKAEQVLKDLPPIMFGHVSLTPESGAVLAQNAKAWEKLGAAFGDDFAKLSDDDVMKALQKSTIDGGALRHLIGVAKAPAVVELVKEEFAGGLEKIIIFAWHTAVVDILRDGLADFHPLVIDGRTPIPDRQGIVRQFQQDPRHRAIIGQIIAAGEGLTMTAANHVLFAEQSWVPKDNMQAAKRAHRIGQTKPVLARFASFPGTIDDQITKAVARKTEMLADLIEEST